VVLGFLHPKEQCRASRAHGVEEVELQTEPPD